MARRPQPSPGFGGQAARAQRLPSPALRDHRSLGAADSLLGDDWDADEAVARLAARTDMVIGEVLLDQTAMAGVGNVYRCELCFLKGLDPWTPVSEVPDLRGLVDLAKKLLELNRHSARHVTTGVDRPGRTHWVYGRKDRPCRRCGTPIRKADQPSYSSERIVYWCPTCQPSRERKGAP